MPYRIEMTPGFQAQFDRLAARERALVLQAVEVRLSYEPLKATRNRKPLRRNTLAPWELRLGDLRVFYEVAGQTVRVIAVGRKRGSTVIIGGEEIQL